MTLKSTDETPRYPHHLPEHIKQSFPEEDHTSRFRKTQDSDDRALNVPEPHSP